MCDVRYEKFVGDLSYTEMMKKFADGSVKSNFEHISYKGSNYYYNYHEHLKCSHLKLQNRILKEIAYNQFKDIETNEEFYFPEPPEAYRLGKISSYDSCVQLFDPIPLFIIYPNEIEAVKKLLRKQGLLVPRKKKSNSEIQENLIDLMGRCLIFCGVGAFVEACFFTQWEYWFICVLIVFSIFMWLIGGGLLKDR